MRNERSIQLENISKVIVDEVHGDFVVQGWDRPEAYVEWQDDLQARPENGVLFLQIHSDGKLNIPAHVDLVIREIHGNLTVDNIDALMTIETVHGDARLQQGGAVQTQEIHGNLKVRSLIGPFSVDRVGGDLDAREISSAVKLNDVGGNARLHAIAALNAGTIGGDLVLRETEGPVQVENVGGNLRAAHLQGGGRLDVGGDLKADFVSGNFECTVGGNANFAVAPQRGESYRIFAGGDIRCHVQPNVGLAIKATSGGETKVKGLPIQMAHGAHSLQTVLGDGSAALEMTAGGNIKLTSDGREVEWEFEFDNDFSDQIGSRAAAFAEHITNQVEQQMSHLARNLDEKFAHFGNEEFAVNIQEKVQSAMQKAEEKIAEAMRRAEQRAREAEARAAEHQARHEERARRHEEQRHQQHVRPQHMHHPRPGVPGMPPVAPPAPAAPQAPAVSSEERMMILKMLSEGQITVEQADQLLAALGGKVTV